MKLDETRVCVQPGNGLIARFPHALVAVLGERPAGAIDALLGRCASIVSGPAKAIAAQLGNAVSQEVPAFVAVADTDAGLALYLHGAVEATVATGPARPLRIPAPSGPAGVWRILPDVFESVAIGVAGVPPPNRIEGPLNLRAGVTVGGGAVLVPSEITQPLDPVAAPIVPGIRCPNGHFNRPEARHCSVDGLVLQVTAGTRAPRPPLGALVLDNGSVYRLDSDYVLGREPELDDAVRAGRARPIPLPDDTREISRVHAAVRLDGWDVMVIDLGSVNGTRVQLPGGPSWVFVGQQQPTPITPGAVMRIGPRWVEYQPQARKRRR
ncbi:MAG: FHA domain-containing protein [Egibacteraceae bacterium]